MFSINSVKNSALRRVLGISGHLVKKNFVSSKSFDYNYFVFGSHVIPHPDKVAKGGEDAFYANEKLVAVADGVGGWADYGVDPAKYSKELCSHIGNLVTGPNTQKYVKNPKSLIVDAAAKTKAEGSSTLVVVAIDPETPVLKSAYIGDSGYVIYRMVKENLTFVHQSPEHTRAFNFPYQIGSQGDSPNMSVEYLHKIENNDIIVVGSDGLFDNMDQTQIAECVKKFANKETGELTSATETAKSIAETAYKYSLNQKYMSPFAKRAREYRYHYVGGKSDDITVVVGQAKIIPKQTEL